MVTAPEEAAREEVMRPPADITGAIRSIVIGIDGRCVIVFARLNVDVLPLHRNGLVIVALDDAFPFHDGWWSGALDVDVAVGIGTEVSRAGSSGEAQDGNREQG
jgi:hypothetical protein